MTDKPSSRITVDKYFKLLDFVTLTSQMPCHIIPELCHACDALKLLREIGEVERVNEK